MIVASRCNSEVQFAVAIEVGRGKNGDVKSIGNGIGQNRPETEGSVSVARLELNVIGWSATADPDFPCCGNLPGENPRGIHRAQE